MISFEAFAMTTISLIIIAAGSSLYLGIAMMFIMFALGDKDSPKRQRIFLGVLGVIMIIAFAGSFIFGYNRWPL